MRILHIHPSLNCGGIEAMICGLANEMVKDQDVTVCSIFKPLLENQFWYKLMPSVKKMTTNKTRTGFSIKEIFKIYNLIRKGSFDVVHLHGFMIYYILTIILLHKKVKFFYTLHSDARMESNKWDRKILAIKKFFFKSHWVTPITISPSSQNSFKEVYKCPSALIQNGIPAPTVSYKYRSVIEKYKITSKTKIFLHAGRIDTAKNQVVMCESFTQLISEGLDIVLLIAGTINNKDIFENLKPYFCERIQYIGELSDLREWFAVVDAMPMPSIWEGLPIALLEAMSVGCIPICSKVGGIPDVVTNGENGLLSATPQTQDFANALRDYLELPVENRKQMVERAIDTFKKSYSIQITTNNYIELYKGNYALT